MICYMTIVIACLIFLIWLTWGRGCEIIIDGPGHTRQEVKDYYGDFLANWREE